MPNWNQLLNDIKAAGSMYDVFRRRYLDAIYKITGRNVIIYYSGWLQKPGIAGADINDEDKIGFMTVIHQLDRSRGLDLILHTPGGEVAATESLVNYIRSMFGTDIRAIVPQLAMSGGTMIACACNRIIMGKHSSLGPIDPHFGGIPAHGVVEEFNRARKEISEDLTKIPIWQPIIAKYSPAFIGECEKAISWSNEMTKNWLRTGMFAANNSPSRKINNILTKLGNHALTKSHNRHLSIENCRDMGLIVDELEENGELQDVILSLHHTCMLTFSATPAYKIIENQNGTAFIKIVQQLMVTGQPLLSQSVELPSQVPELKPHEGNATNI
ncbi:MAG: SDH family Clp fold serine proteinase [Paludibacter sp.]